jgi:hypothetical protein
MQMIAIHRLFPHKHCVAAVLAALALVAPAMAIAQPVPSYASQAASPNTDEQIRGRVTAFDDRYDLTVRDERGYIDKIVLHEGTIINPTGLTLAPGMIVSVLGYNAGSYFSANEIDTPYTFYSGVPYFQGHPWSYYGPTVSLGFFFGSTGWWHGGAFGGGFHYAGGARVYAHVNMSHVYNHGVRNGGSFHGHDFVAPRSHGGYHAFATHGGFHGGGFHGGHAGGHGGGHH